MIDQCLASSSPTVTQALQLHYWMGFVASEWLVKVVGIALTSHHAALPRLNHFSPGILPFLFTIRIHVLVVTFEMPTTYRPHPALPATA